jgi:hypothetical protein
MYRKTFASLCMAVLLSFGIVACGGGGGSSSSAVATSPPPVVDSTGVVAIAVKDAPSDDFDKIMLTLTSVQLLGNGAPVTVFEGDKTFDLLDLQSFYDMLAVSDQVPVGSYSKIRLRVTDILLIQDDGNGGETVIEADIPANGKIDLNPRGSFTVSADTAILIEIDLDAKKSIHVVGTGSGSYKFRPVVFVDVQERQLLNGLVRVHGTIGDIAEDNSYLELCDVEIQLTTRSNRCVIVNLIPDETSLFDANGDEIDIEDVRNETPPVEATVYGIAVVSTDPEYDDSDSDSDSSSDSDSGSDSDSDSNSDSDSDSDDDDTVRMVQVDAIVIQLGPNSAALQLDGTVLTDLNADNEFDFDIAPGQGFTEDSVVTTLVQSATRILSSDLTELDASAIVQGAEAAVAGVLQLGDPDQLKSTLIIIQDDVTAEERLEGPINEILEDTFLLEVEMGDVCVAPTADAEFYSYSDDEGVTREDGLENLREQFGEAGPLNATVFGKEGFVNGCFQASLIFSYDPADDPEPI